jgi:hypothetical protein
MDLAYLIVHLVVPLVLVGLALWVINMIPMDATIKRIIYVVIVICVALWLLLGVLVPLLETADVGYHRRL